MSKLNQMYNDIRVAMKEPDAKKRHELIVPLIEDIAKTYNNVDALYNHPEFAMMTHYAGFALISLALGALSPETPPEDYNNFVVSIVTMCTSAMTEVEGLHGTKEEV